MGREEGRRRAGGMVCPLALSPSSLGLRAVRAPGPQPRPPARLAGARARWGRQGEGQWGADGGARVAREEREGRRGSEGGRPRGAGVCVCAAGPGHTPRGAQPFSLLNAARLSGTPGASARAAGRALSPCLGYTEARGGSGLAGAGPAGAGRARKKKRGRTAMGEKKEGRHLSSPRAPRTLRARAFAKSRASA
jgi:hypothetical protein